MLEVKGPWPCLARALLILCLVESALARPQLYIVSGTKSRMDGVYRQQEEHGSKFHYTKMGSSGSIRATPMLFSSPKFPQTWLLGLGNSAHFKAPGSKPPSTGWSSTTKDGQDTGAEQKDISVTSVRLNAATEQQMFDGEGADTDDGVVCKMESENLIDSDQWIKISNESPDQRYCDKKRHCKTGIDEPVICRQHRVVVTGSLGEDGIYDRASHVGPNVYEQPGKNSFIFKRDGRWKISKGPPQRAVVLFESGKSDMLPSKGWTWTGADRGGGKQRKTLGQMQDLRVKVVDSEFEKNNSAGWHCDDYDRNFNLIFTQISFVN